MYRCFYEPAVACAIMAFHGTLSHDDWQAHLKDVQRLGSDRAAGAERLALLLLLSPRGGAPDAAQRKWLRNTLERPEHDALAALVANSRLFRGAARVMSLGFRGSLRTFASVEPALGWLRRQRRDTGWLQREVGGLRGLVPEALLDA